jgi:hypothetical protein
MTKMDNFVKENDCTGIIPVSSFFLFAQKLLVMWPFFFKKEPSLYCLMAYVFTSIDYRQYYYNKLEYILQYKEGVI